MCIRDRAYADTEYFALLHIKDSYPYKNKYVKNQFGQFLGVGRSALRAFLCLSVPA